MKLGTPGFVGSRLREAREVRNVTGVGLAEIADIRPQSVFEYEAGRSTPSPRVVAALATALNVPEHFFLRPERPAARGNVFFRSMSSATKAARARARVRSRWLSDIVGYVSEYVELPKPNFPQLGLPADPLLLSDADIEQAAEDVRRFWSMRDGPIANTVLLLENQGAVVARDALGAESLDGLSELVAEDARPHVVVGTDKGTAVRWRFDVAHELGHILLHASLAPDRLLRPEQFKRIEEQAHRFAAAFLLPMTSFGEDLFAVNLDVFRSLKPKWKVSIAMMIRRALHAGLISEDIERSLWINFGRRGWRRNEPYDQEMEAEEPRLLRRSFELLLAEGGQTPDDIVTSLALPPGDIEALGGLPSGYLSTFARVALRRSSAGTADDAGARSLIRFPNAPAN